MSAWYIPSSLNSEQLVKPMFTNIKYYINYVLIEAHRAEICVIHSNAKTSLLFTVSVMDLTDPIILLQRHNPGLFY